ncbi:nuclear transport factor 2 family protein (plasmid) [Rhizobium sullae]|uniref:Nuclear transport factor 2 family protein n=1 Tax=Rhizobium sullae TaxID=50338 RepID=A0ABY5XQH8_RHISU|nr:nuclear transport factor 2 family protein [Rhizobium sullae]UWU16750.1 nuclear transport factor 2 family protein [Rhizobium sullae]
MSRRKTSVATLRGTAVAVAVSAATAFAGTAIADETANKATIQTAFDAWASGTGSPYDLLADNVEWTITGNSAASKTYRSRDAFINEVIKPFNSRMSVGLKPTIRDIYADRDTVIVFFDAAGTAKDGQRYKNTYAWFLDLDGGRIVKASAFFDSIAFNKLWELPVAAE